MSRAALLAHAVAVAVTGAACGTSGPERKAPTEVRGPVVQVREEGGAVTSFVVEAEEGRYELHVDPAVDYGFDLAHLREHRASGDPVLARIEERDGVLYAVWIDDA